MEIEPGIKRLNMLPIRVLVVEDDRDHAETIRQVLIRRTEVAYQVEIAKTASEAIEKLTHDAFDAVLLDLSLPDAKGIDAVRRISDASKDVGVIVLTGWGGPETEQPAKDAGADAYLQKPTQPAEMSKKLQFVVINKRLEKERHTIEKSLEELGSIIMRVGNLIEKVDDKVSESSERSVPPEIRGESGGKSA